MSQKTNDSGNNGAGADKPHGHSDHAKQNEKKAEAKTSHEADLGMEKYSKSKSDEVAHKRQLRKSGATGHGVPSADSLLPKDTGALGNHTVGKHKSSEPENKSIAHQQHHAPELIAKSAPSSNHDANDIIARSHKNLESEKINTPAEHSGWHLQQPKEVSNLTGTLTSPDESKTYRVDKGQISDEHGKPVAQLLADGTLRFSGSNLNRANEDVNVAFHNYKFDGSENGAARHFVASTRLPDGKLFLPDQNNHNTECIVRMGMIIDKQNGKQIGNFVEPPNYEGNRLNPGKIALASDPMHPIAMTDARFKNAVFDINLKGQVFDDHRRLQGVCTGDRSIPTIDLQSLIQEERKFADSKDAKFQSKGIENTTRGLLGDNRVYDEHQALGDRLAKTMGTVNEILRTGHADISKLASMDQQARIESGVASAIEKLAAPSLPRPPKPSEHLQVVAKIADLHANKRPVSEITEKHEIQAKSNPSTHISSIPEIRSADASKINGILRIDEDVYKINHGQLFKIENSGKGSVENKTPCGVLGPGYLYQMRGEKIASLADQNRVLMKFQIEGSKDPTLHSLIGLGASYINKTGERVAGGLVSAKDLITASVEPALAVDKQKHESESKRNWFDNTISSTLTSGLDQDVAAKVDRSKELAVQSSQRINSLFSHGFDKQNFSASQFDTQNKEIRHLMKDANLSAVSSAELIQKHEITNTLIREGLITGAATAASVVATAMTEGAAAPVAAVNIARGAELINMARSLGASATAVGSLNAVLCFKEGNTAAETVQQSTRNFGDGVLQAFAMKIPAGQIKELGDIAKASNIGKTIVQTELFQAGQRLRETGNVVPTNSQEACAELAAGAGMALFTHGIGLHMEKLPVLGNAVKDADSQLAKCAQMKINGGDATTIESLTKQAMLNKELAGYLLNAVHTGTTAATFSGMPAIPEAVQNEKLRIEKQLGKTELTAAEFLEHMNLQNMTSYVAERAGIAAVTSAVFTKPSSALFHRATEHRQHSSDADQVDSLRTVSDDHSSNYAKAKIVHSGPADESSGEYKSWRSKTAEVSEPSDTTQLPPKSSPLDKFFNRSEMAVLAPIMEAFEQRGVRENFAPNDTYQHLSEMLKAGDSAVPLEQRKEMVYQLLSNMATLPGIGQGLADNCTLAGLANQLYARHPDQVAKLISETVQFNETATVDGEFIYLPERELVPDLAADEFSATGYPNHRCHADQLLQKILANLHWQTKETFLPEDGGPARSFELGQIQYFKHDRATEFGSGERLIGTSAKANKKEVLGNHPYLSIFEMKSLYTSVTGKSGQNEFVMVRDHGRVFSATDMKNIHFDANEIGLNSMLERLQPLRNNPITVSVHTDSEAFMKLPEYRMRDIDERGLHILTIVGYHNSSNYQPATISYYDSNHPHKQRSMLVSDLLDAMLRGQ